MQDGFRLPTVLQTGVGDWVHQGWGALTVLPGASTHEGTLDWSAVITAGRALHRATAGMPRPSLLDSRTDAWAVADRLAWDETLCGAPPEVEDCLARLRAALVQPDEAAQVVHGDLTTNVLTAPGQVPSIIDFSPYWRPPSYSEGIVFADALCWYAPVPHLHDKLDVPLAAVARGLLFRLLTTIQGPHAPAENDGAVDLSRYKNAMGVLHL